PARGVGRVYAANTAGAILGALAASLVLVAWIGSQHAQQVMIGVALVSATLMLLVSRPRSIGTESHTAPRLLVAVALVAGVAMAATVPPLPGILVGYGRHAAAWSGHANEIIYVGEGLHASVAVSRTESG